MSRLLASVVALLTVVACTGPIGPETATVASPAGRETAAPEAATEAGALEEIRVAADEAATFGEKVAGAISVQLEFEGDVKSPAARLRSRLDSLLREHAVLVAEAGAAAAAGEDDRLQAVADSLDHNAIALAETVATTFAGAGLAEEFLAVWEPYVGAVLEYLRTSGTVSGATPAGPEIQLAAGLAELTETATNGEAAREEVESTTRELVEVLVAVIETQTTAPSGWFEDLPPATDAAAELAEVLAGEFAAFVNAQGDIRSLAATVRAELAGRLEDHVYFTAIAARELLLGHEEAFRAAREQLVDHSTERLTEFFATNYEPATGERFREIWTGFVDTWFAYVRRVRGDSTPDAEMREQLDSFGGRLGAFAAEVTDEHAEAQDVSESVLLYVDAMRNAVGALAAATE